MKNFKPIELFNLLFLITIILTDVMYMYINGSEYIFKTLPTITFVIGGLVNLVYVIKNKHNFDSFSLFKYFMMIGLISAALGDILLIDFFVFGVIFFALGHVLFFISFCFVIKPNWLDVAVSSCIFVPVLLLILLYKNFDFNGLMPVIIIYALIISFMMGKTISNLIRDNNKKNLLLVIGSILFTLSDLVLLFRLFAGAPRSFSVLCVALYYPAEFFLAYSIYYVSKTTKNIKEQQ